MTLIRHSPESFTPLFAELEDEDGCKRIKANSRAEEEEEEDNINRTSDHRGGEEEEGERGRLARNRALRMSCSFGDILCCST